MVQQLKKNNLKHILNNFANECTRRFSKYPEPCLNLHLRLSSYLDSVVYERMDAEITAIKIKLGHNKSADILPRS